MLKWFAVVCMVADHLRYVVAFDPGVDLLLSFVGRLAMPVFCWLAALGVARTSDWRKYVTRLLVAGVLAQPFFVMLFGHDWYHLNVLFALALGVLCGVVLIQRVALVYLPLILLYSFFTEYGPAAVLLVGVLSVGFSSRRVWPFVVAPFFVGMLNTGVLFACLGLLAYGLCLCSLFRWGAALDRMFEWRNRVFFYAFYPSHLIVFASLNYLN